MTASTQYAEPLLAPALNGDASWFEASARQRIDGLLDAHTFQEFLGPEHRETSPHLAIFDLPTQFDDGMVVGEGRLNGAAVMVAAQEGKFMGGAFGEVHGAKLTGLLRAAAVRRVPVVGLIGGRAGCYGGGSLIAGCCSGLAISELGRLSVSGPEVIETNRGIEEFDAADRPLIWRTMGGKHRYLLGAVEAFVDDSIPQFRHAAIGLIAQAPALNLDRLALVQSRLADRLARFGGCADATDVWRALGVDANVDVPDLEPEAFLALAQSLKEAEHDVR